MSFEPGSVLATVLHSIHAAYPHWLERLNDTQLDSGSPLRWECKATGKPQPTYRWLRNGAPLQLQVPQPTDPLGPKACSDLAFMRNTTGVDTMFYCNHHNTCLS